MKSKLLNFLTFFSREALHLLGAQGPCCRYEPTCSAYFRQAVAEHGFFRGSWFGLCRVLRCSPIGGSGWDPIPCAKQDRSLVHSGEQA